MCRGQIVVATDMDAERVASQERGRDGRGASAGDETAAHSSPGGPMAHSPVERVARRPHIVTLGASKDSPFVA